MATKKGTIKKTAVKEYLNIRANGLVTIKLDAGDELKWIQETTGVNDVVISTSAGQAMRFNEQDVRSMGRAARGVRGIRLRPKDEIVGMDVIRDRGQKLLVMSANGYGKATLAEQFPAHKRAVHTLDPVAKEVIMMSTKGIAIRVAVADIPTLGRAAQGVRVMKMNDGDTVASIGLVLPDEEESDNKAA